MSEYRDTGEVKARLSGLFRAELGFIKLSRRNGHKTLGRMSRG
jgi:hypothetical protein